jgi:iron(III) transport system substrate-binding protein
MHCETNAHRFFGSRLFVAASLVIAVAFAATSATVAHANELNVYTYRESKLVQPLFDAFTAVTGIRVNILSASAGLEQRIKSEGVSSPADVLLTVDISRLEDAVRLGITQPLDSKIVDDAVPSRFRDPEQHWAAVALRARVVYASKSRVQQSQITYEELAEPKWKGKVCIRSGQHMYNNALFAAMIVKHGEAKTEAWLAGLKANLAQKPSGGDREVARDIAAGKCDIGLGNTYYWALMNDFEVERKSWAQATKVMLPTFTGGGTHVNLSGVALIKTAPNKANAMKFIEWMVGPKAQQMHADLNYEYPVLDSVPINKTIANYGPLNPDSMPLAQIAANRKKAAVLVDKVGFDN